MEDVFEGNAFDWAVVALTAATGTTWIGLMLSHALLTRNPTSVLNVQSLLAIPVASLLTSLKFFYPPLSPWLDILVICTMVYGLISFGALMLAHVRERRGDLGEELRDGRFASFYFSCLDTASKKWLALRCMIFQFLVFGPLAATLEAIAIEFGDLRIGFPVVFFSIGISSLMVLMQGLLIMHDAFKNVISMHRPGLKFMIHKIIPTAMLLNVIILSQLVGTIAIPVPDQLCNQISHPDKKVANDMCAGRYITFILSCEIFLTMVVACYAFSHKEYEAESRIRAYTSDDRATQMEEGKTNTKTNINDSSVSQSFRVERQQEKETKTWNKGEGRYNKKEEKERGETVAAAVEERGDTADNNNGAEDCGSTSRCEHFTYVLCHCLAVWEVFSEWNVSIASSAVDTLEVTDGAREGSVQGLGALVMASPDSFRSPPLEPPSPPSPRQSSRREDSALQ